MKVLKFHYAQSNIAEHAYIHLEDQSSHCSLSDDSFLKDKVEELDQKVDGIFNQTQGTGNKNRTAFTLYMHVPAT